MRTSSLYDSSRATPHVKKVRLRTDTDFLTEAKDNEPGEIKYLVDGTAYGKLHKTNGDIRFWKSESGARKALAKYKRLGCL